MLAPKTWSLHIAPVTHPRLILAQVNGRNGISWEEKFRYDVEYVDHISFRGDLCIVLKTIKTVIKKEGISSATNITMEPFRGNEG